MVSLYWQIGLCTASNLSSKDDADIKKSESIETFINGYFTRKILLQANFVGLIEGNISFEGNCLHSERHRMRWTPLVRDAGA